VIPAAACGCRLRNAWISACFEDREGNFWLGSHTEGLFRLPLAALPDPRRAAPPEDLLAEWVVSMDGRGQSGQRVRCCNGGGRSRMLPVDDVLWLPSISGVLKIDPQAASRSRVEPLVHIEAVQQGEYRLLIGLFALVLVFAGHRKPDRPPDRPAQSPGRVPADAGTAGAPSRGRGARPHRSRPFQAGERPLRPRLRGLGIAGQLAWVRPGDAAQAR